MTRASSKAVWTVFCWAAFRFSSRVSRRSDIGPANPPGPNPPRRPPPNPGTGPGAPCCAAARAAIENAIHTQREVIACLPPSRVHRRRPGGKVLRQFFEGGLQRLFALEHALE